MDCFVAEPVIGPAKRPDPLAPRHDEEKIESACPPPRAYFVAFSGGLAPLQGSYFSFGSGMRLSASP